MVQEARRPGRPRRNAAALTARERVLAAAGNLFLRHGYNRVTMEMVARSASVTKTAVYYHFADKSALLTESVTAMFSRVRQHTLAILMLDLPLRERILRITLTVMSVAEALATFDTTMLEAMGDLSEDQLCAIRSSENAIHMDVIQFLTAAAQRGEIAKGDPKLRTFAYIALLNVGHFRGPDNKPHFSDHKLLAEGLVDLLFRGLDAR